MGGHCLGRKAMPPPGLNVRRGLALGVKRAGGEESLGRALAAGPGRAAALERADSAALEKGPLASAGRGCRRVRRTGKTSPELEADRLRRSHLPSHYADRPSA